jgi:hypothetical protein
MEFLVTRGMKIKISGFIGTCEPPPSRFRAPNGSIEILLLERTMMKHTIHLIHCHSFVFVVRQVHTQHTTTTVVIPSLRIVGLIFLQQSLAIHTITCEDNQKGFINFLPFIFSVWEKHDYSNNNGFNEEGDENVHRRTKS